MWLSEQGYDWPCIALTGRAWCPCACPQFSGIAPQPRVPRRAAPFSAGAAGLPPTSGQRPGQHQHQLYQQQAAAAGPSRPSLSGTQSHAATPGGPLPSTLAVALGALSPPGHIGVVGQLTPQHGGFAVPSPQLPASSAAAGIGGLLPPGPSMGLPPSLLGGIAAPVLQGQSSMLGAQQQQQQPWGQVQPPQPQAPPPSPLQPPQHASQQATAATPFPAQPLQALQHAETLQGLSAAALMLQAQASGIISAAPAAPTAQQHQQPKQQPGLQMQHGGPSPTSGMTTPAAAGLQQQQQQQQQGAPGTSEAGQAQAQAAASQGAASAQSLPSLVGASAIQGHTLPPPFHGAAATPVPLQSFGGTPAAGAAAAAAPATVHCGAFAAPGPLAAAAAVAAALLPAVPPRCW